MDLKEVTLEDLMKWIGDAGHYVLGRFDPLREKNNFTVVIDEKRLCDTDNPFGELSRWYFGEGE